jgi:hypothetical protein
LPTTEMAPHAIPSASNGRVKVAPDRSEASEA